MGIISKLKIKIFGRKVGIDKFGNQYYLSTKKNHLGYNKRYVIYNGLEDSSKIPPIWHAWLHYLIHEIPGSDLDSSTYAWQQEHTPNLSGTIHAYSPSSSKANKLYSKWVP
jgi:NADH:ubiquinone oxidoreductase subunit